MAMDINDIMAVAQAAAVNAAVPATATQATQVATRGHDLTLDDVLSSGLAVDDWLKVGYNGMALGSEDKVLFDEMIVNIDLTEVVPYQMVKYGPQGGQPTYKKTRDGVTVVGGGSWTDVLAQAARVTGKEAQVYTAVDIPMEVTEDFVVNGKVLAEAGTMIGHTTSTTNFKLFKAYLRDCNKKGWKTKTVRTKLGHVSRAENGFKWGIISFTPLDVAGIETVAQAA